MNEMEKNNSTDSQAGIKVENKKSLTEEQLDQISGGFIYPTENRFDPNVCPGLTRTRYECVGLFQFCNCDHYKRELFGTGKYSYWHYCNTNGFKAYKGDYNGNPDPS